MKWIGVALLIGASAVCWARDPAPEALVWNDWRQATESSTPKVAAKSAARRLVLKGVKLRHATRRQGSKP